jgi:hypothetical protein
MRRLQSHTARLAQERAGNGSHDSKALAKPVLGWNSDRLFATPGDVYSYSSPMAITNATFEPTVAMTFPLALDHRAATDSSSALRPTPMTRRGGRMLATC